jgi:hypothetical protein
MHLKGQDIDGIEYLQRCKAEGEDETKDVDHGKSCRAAGLGCVWRWDTVIIPATVGAEGASGCSNSDPDTSTAEVGEQEKWATTESIDTSRTDQGQWQRLSKC